jgi:hypothetical protein
MRIIVSDWKKYEGTGALQGFFKMTVETTVRGHVYGLVIKCSLFQQENGSRWIGMPQKTWNKRNGTVAYEDQVDYTDQETEEYFHKEVFAQLEKLQEAAKPEPEPANSPIRQTEPGTQLAPVITDEDIPF